MPIQRLSFDDCVGPWLDGYGDLFAQLHQKKKTGAVSTDGHLRASLTARPRHDFGKLHLYADVGGEAGWPPNRPDIPVGRTGAYI